MSTSEQRIIEHDLSECEELYTGSPIEIEGVTYLGFTINRMDGFMNPYRIKLIADSIPKELADPLYHTMNPQSDGSRILFAESHGIVNFYSESSRNNHGYGGATFNLRIKDTTEAGEHRYDLKGPWSSRSTAVNKYLEAEGNMEQQCMETEFRVLNYVDISVQQICGIRGVTIPTLVQILRHFSPNVTLGTTFVIARSSPWDHEISYVVTDMDAASRKCIKALGNKDLVIDLIIDPQTTKLFG